MFLKLHSPDRIGRNYVSITLDDRLGPRNFICLGGAKASKLLLP